MALLACLMMGSADAQVSVRRTQKNPQQSSQHQDNAKPRKGSDRRNSDANSGADNSAKPAATTAPKPAAKPAAKPTSEPASNQDANPVVAKKNAPKKTGKKEIEVVEGKSVRQQVFDQYQKESQEATPWQHVVYREIDMTKEQNASLYFPTEPQDGLTNMFNVLVKALANGELTAYEYLDGRELFTEKYKLNVKSLFDKHEIFYQEEAAKGRNGVTTYLVEDIDIPSAEVLSYYVKERWEFDQKHSRYTPRIICVCPVLHRAGDMGDQKQRYPLFWVNFEDIRPLLRQHLVVSSGMNTAARYTMEEFFTLYQYDGTIYKDQNLRGLTLQQQYPDPDSLKLRQQELDKQLRGFGDSIWVSNEPVAQEEPKKSRHDKKAQKEADQKAVVAETTEATPSAPVATGKKNRRTKQEVVVDEAAEAAKKSKSRSVRR